MINCQDLKFSPMLCRQRIPHAESILGTSVFNRIICFALYHLGAKRQNISDLLNMPAGTVRSIIRAIHQGGLAAFEDRRKRIPTIVSPPLQRTQKAFVNRQEQSTIITIGNTEMRIPVNNPLQTKVVLLTLLDNGLLNNSDVAKILNISKVQVSNLSKALRDQDVPSLIDKRKGQIQDYRFTPEIKAELIQQVAANAITGKPTSSRVISEQINERCNLKLPDRSIRLHMKKLGLPNIASSLPVLVDTLKKISLDPPKQQ
jgi:transcription initiation factor IIE alpha subunit